MMPKTKHGHPALVCVSAMQKCIRRGLEADAMAFACELVHTSKAYCTLVCNRLVVISPEDVDSIRAPWIVPYVAAAIDQVPALYAKNPANPGGARMVIGNVIRLLARAPKSREGDHFQAAIGLANLLEGRVPEIPDWVYDKHTHAGKRAGRGLDHFRTEGTVLVDADGSRVPEDRYADEAYRLWRLRDQRRGADSQTRMFSESDGDGDES